MSVIALNQLKLSDLQAKQGIRLDVGCGFNKQDGFIGMDKREVDGVDIVHNVEDIPYPLPDECCEMIVMSHLMEHICPKKTISVMNELWRISRLNGLLLIAMPYATSFGFYQDPTHCNPWNQATPTYFIKGQPLYEVYRPKPWKPDEKAHGGITWNLTGNLEIALRKVVDG